MRIGAGFSAIIGRTFRTGDSIAMVFGLLMTSDAVGPGGRWARREIARCLSLRVWVFGESSLKQRYLSALKHHQCTDMEDDHSLPTSGTILSSNSFMLTGSRPLPRAQGPLTSTSLPRIHTVIVGYQPVPFSPLSNLSPSGTNAPSIHSLCSALTQSRLL